MNANELADNQLTHVIGENNNGEEVVITLRKPLYLESFVRQQQAEIEALKAIVEKLTADWTDGFRKYEYNSDEPEENKLRDDVFAMLRKAQEK